MSLDPSAQAAVALHRFGLGPRPGAIAAIRTDPRGAMLGDIARPDAARLATATLLPSDAAMRLARGDRVERRERRRQAAVAENEGRGKMAGDSAPGMGGTPEGLKIERAEAGARIQAALAADIGFAERLVWFWSNHFCISTRKGFLRPMAGAFEREAIRPHILGRFADLLLAVESHPAMLIYLDNNQSIGPNSRAGRNRGRGLNENLAREILELHTLGVRTVYDQADVTSLAKILTGWAPRPARNEDGARFEFNEARHEPGAHAVLGKTYAEAGVEQGRAVLRDLARHPATARHVATKLATHFVADAPAPALVSHLSDRFLETDGDLMEVSRALVHADAAWDAPRRKLKRPGEWIVSALRAVGASADIDLVLQSQATLGEPLWRPDAPAGFSDQSSEWIDGLAERLDVAATLARTLAGPEHPSRILAHALGPLASSQTANAVARAEDRTQALTLVFMAPEFQQR